MDGQLEEIKNKLKNSNALTPFSQSEVNYLIQIIEQQREENERLETELMMLR